MSTLKVNEVRHLSNTGTANIVLESNNNTNLQTASTKALSVDGTLTVTGVATFNGNAVIGNASSDTLTLTSTVSGSANYSGFTGEIRMYAGNAAGNSPPTGWLYCNGDTIGLSQGDQQSASYQALFNLLKESNDFGNASSAVWGTNTVKLPDFRSRAPVGIHTGAANAIGAGLTSRTLSDTAGAETHALTVAELAEHTHGATSDNPSGWTISGTLPDHVHSMTHTHQISAGTTSSAVPNDLSSDNDFQHLVRTAVGGQSTTAANVDATTSGSEIDLMDSAVLSSHSHTYPEATSQGVSTPNTGNPTSSPTVTLANTNHTHTITTTNATHSSVVASNTAHNNLSPIIAVNYIIKV